MLSMHQYVDMHLGKKALNFSAPLNREKDLEDIRILDLSNEMQCI